jgi:hypothetical protein
MGGSDSSFVTSVGIRKLHKHIDPLKFVAAMQKYVAQFPSYSSLNIH